MPRNQPNTNLMALALEARVPKKTLAQPAAEPRSPPAETENAEPSPPPEARPKSHRRKRPRERSSRREGRGKEREGRSKEPEDTSDPVWQPTFSLRGGPITESMSLEDDARLAAELSGALLLPKDVEAANKMDKRKLTRSAIHLHAMSLQRSYIAFSNLEAEVREAEAVKQQNADLLLALNNGKVAQIEAEDARKAAEIAKREAEDEALAAKSHAAEVEHLLAENKRELAERERELAELKLQQREKEDEAYNEGLDFASQTYTAQMLEVREVLFAKGWTSAMKKAGIQEDSSLFIVENPFEEPAEASPAAAPTSPAASPSSSVGTQNPSTPLE